MPTRHNPLREYDAIAANTKIQFKSGTQAALNVLIQNGGAIEGTFYLTTDTHKLYVGRKKTTGGLVYPEQVSRGVTVVGTTEDLPTVNPSSSDVPSGAIEEGELFYITNTNVLAALRKVPNSNPVTYEWVQINPPTGISDVSTAASTNGSNVDVRTTISTAAGEQIGAFQIAAGDNVALTSGTGTVDLGSSTRSGQGQVTISATDTTYKPAVETNTSKGVLGLISKTTGSFGTTLDSSKIDIEGVNSVKVTSNATNSKITVTGPNLTGVAVENHTTDGFTISLSGTNGDGSAIDSAGTRFQPKINYGATSGYSAPTSTVAFNQSTQAAFANGVATLNVYTKAQADQAIHDAIDAELATANAMTYRGVVTSANASGDTTSLWQQVQTNGAHNGDVYKVSAIDDDNPITIGGKVAQVGDLIIISGSETNGLVPIPDNNAAGLLTICDLIPSGDEPEFVATPITSITRDNVSGFVISDGKIANSNLLTTNFISGNKIDITSAASGKTIDITVGHSTTSRSDVTNEALQNHGTANAVFTKSAANSTDDISTNTVELFAFSDPSKALVTDAYGHVTGFKGKKINFKHNSVDGLIVEYNSTNSNVYLTPNNTIAGFNSASASLIKFSSDTLQIKGNVNTSDHSNDSLKIDLVWGTF